MNRAGVIGVNLQVFKIFAGLVAAAALIPAAALRPVQSPYPDFDAAGGIRVGTAASTAAPAARTQAVVELERSIGPLRVSYNAISRAPRKLSGTQPLSGPALGSPVQIARAFLAARRSIWGLSSDEVDRLDPAAAYTDRHNGVTHVFFRQDLEGVPVFTAALGVHLDAKGRVLSVKGDVYPGLQPAGSPSLLPEHAARIAAAGVGIAYDPRRVGQEGETVILAPGPLLDEIRVERWVYPLLGSSRMAYRMLLNKNGLEWYDALVDASSGELLHRRNLYQFTSALSPSAPAEANPAPPRGLVSVEHPLATVRGTGDLARRYPYTTDPSGGIRGFANAPLFGADVQPVNPNGGNPDNATIDQVLLPLPHASAPLRSSALPLSSSPQSPAGWFVPLGGQLVTFGNNVDAKDDHAGDDESTSGHRASGGPSGDFSGPAYDYRNLYGQGGPYPVEGTLQPASSERLAGGAADLDPAVLTLFYFANWYHDFLYHLGFTEAAGNFQDANFGRGGLDGDLVYADVQDGSGTNNANFGTPPDGSNPRMQMYLFSGPDRDGDFDIDIVIHEYTHGLSNRLVGGPSTTDCLGTPLVGESGGMGEGWGDWYAAVITDEPAVAEYSVDDPVKGIRRFSMDNGPADFTYGFMCTGPASNPSLVPCEVHDVGEFWSIVLWEMRESLINRQHNRAFPSGPAFPTFTAVGSPLGNIQHAQGRTADGSEDPSAIDSESIEAGSFEALFRVTDAMKLAPCNPTVVDMRDAILEADRAIGGEHQDLIWRAFANRGVGVLATSTGAVNPAIVEDFAVPPTVAACEAAGGPLAAPAFTATSSANNEVTITITPNGATEYVIHRSSAGAGSAVDPELYVEVARIGGTSFTDTGLDGGVTYHYRVRAARNADCVSGSSVQAVVPLGTGLDCQVDPSFDGLTRVLDAGDCENLLLDWRPAISHCSSGQTLKYNVYRSTAAFFTPGPANLLASGVTGLSYRDDPGPTSGLFYYVVRAEDSTSGHGGPANGGNEDANVLRVSGLVTGGTLVNQGFADDVEEGPDNGRSARFTSNGLLVPPVPERGGWYRDADASPVVPRSGQTVWHTFNPDNPTVVPGDSTVFELRSDVMTITPDSILTFHHTFQTEEGFDGGVIEFAQVLDETTGSVSPFQDLGFLLYEGGYNGVLDATIEGLINNNPLANRPAYTGGLLGSMRRARAFVGALVPSGESETRIVVRFLFGNDVGNTNDPSPTGDYLPGWYIDDVTLDESCCPLSNAPSGLTAVAGEAEITLAWNAPGGSIDHYEIFREASNEGPPATMTTRIATVPGGQTSYVDSAVAPGILFHYVVRAVPVGNCPSGESNRASASPLGGECTASPTFAGITRLSAPPAATCGLALSWNAGFANCPGHQLHYNVYRSTDPGFIPGPASLVVAGLDSLSYVDQGVLEPGTTYHYVVRAEDTTTGNEGPANGGNEDTNLVRLGRSPLGALVPGPNFTDDLEPGAEDGYTTFSTRTAGGWAVLPDATATSPTNAWVALDDQPGAPELTSKDDRLTLPPLNLTSTSTLSFRHNFDFARFVASSPSTAYQSGGVLELSADGTSWIDLGPYVVSSGYNGVIDAESVSPLAGRPAWVGSSDGDLFAGRGDTMKAVVVNVGGAVAGEFAQAVLPEAQVRLRLGGTFQLLLGGIQGSGWGVDNLAVTGLLVPGACMTNAGNLPPTLRVDRVSEDVVRLVWDASCSSGATDYGIYEGQIGSWYGHTAIDCSDDGGDLEEDVLASAGDRYYLVVPHNPADEGSYGRDSTGAERPIGSTTCVPQQVVASCP